MKISKSILEYLERAEDVAFYIVFYLWYASFLVLAMLLFFLWLFWTAFRIMHKVSVHVYVYTSVVLIHIDVPSVGKQRCRLAKPINFSYSIPSLVTVCFERPRW